MLQKLRNVPYDTAVLFLLFIAAVLAFGLYIPDLGLFGDDWPHLWVYHMFGLDGFTQLVQWDRPFSSWVYWPIAPIAGENIAIYHFYLLILQWIGSFLFYLIVKRLFPDSRPFPFWSAMFFLLYPGFRQQPQPLEFILHFTVFDLFLLSIWCMLKSVENEQRRFLYQLIGTISAFSIFSIEYFIGLELLRPIFLWMVLRKSQNSRPRLLFSILRFWLPYLVVLIVYAYWRIFVFSFPTYQPTFLSNLFIDPLRSLLGLAQVLTQEIRSTVLGAWRQVISIPLTSNTGFQYLLLVIISFIGTFSWLKIQKQHAEDFSPLSAFLVGGAAIFFAGIPFWITGIPIQLDFPWDRSTLPFMVGVSLLTACGLLFFRPAYRNIIAAGLISFSIGMHFQNAGLYQIEWEKLQQFFWQLTWRAPSMKPGTIVISEDIPIFYYGDNNFTAVLNWTYAPDHKGTNIPYNFFDMGERLGTNLSRLEPGLPVKHGYRFLNFESTSDMLLPVYFSENKCLRVLDSSKNALINVPDRLGKSATFSNPEALISDTSNQKPPAFLPEPDHDWCYFYQKAELYTEKGDWNTVLEYHNDATVRRLSPVDKSELSPFIIAMYQTGRIQEAINLSFEMRGQEGNGEYLCLIWDRMPGQESNGDLDVAEIKNSLNCGDFH
jgi:hypothetical protein